MRLFSIFILVIMTAVVLGRGESGDVDRPSITFIVDTDQDGDSYFLLAKEYYLRQAGRTDYVIDECLSLECILTYLSSASFHSHLPWGQVNVVAHGNPWTGLSLQTLEDVAGRTVTNSIIAELVNGNIVPLDTALVDRETRIEFIACGLGQNVVLLEALEMAVVGLRELPPEVTSSSFFVDFFRDDMGNVEKRYLMPHYAFYRTAYRPANLHLARQLSQRYPNASIDWLSGMDRTRWIDRSDVFSKRFNVPINWKVPLPQGQSPSLNSESEKIDFIAKQEDLVTLLTEYDIPIDKFRWNISIEKNYIQIKGKATVLCVLEEKALI